jgi:hypothetical protein
VRDARRGGQGSGVQVMVSNDFHGWRVRRARPWDYVVCKVVDEYMYMRDVASRGRAQSARRRESPAGQKLTPTQIVVEACPEVDITHVERMDSSAFQA